MASSSLLCLRRPLPLPGRLHVRSSDLSLRPDNPNPIIARDRSKNRKPIQRGRYLSIEAIRAVQSLKRAKINGGDSLEAVMQSKVQRLVKRDLVSVLKELLNQGKGFLALQVFEEVRDEHWYKPQLPLYVDMITVLANNGLHENVRHVCSYLLKERLEPDTEGFNMLLRTLLNFGFNHTATDCFRLMKLWESEPDETTFRILVHGLECNGEMDLSVAVKHESDKYLDGQLEFLEEKEETVLNGA